MNPIFTAHRRAAWKSPSKYCTDKTVIMIDFKLGDADFRTWLLAWIISRE